MCTADKTGQKGGTTVRAIERDCVIFNVKKYSRFKKKIIYLVCDDFPINLNPWQRQAYQREFILNGLNKAKPEDYIIFSDPDEIPRPEKLKNINLKKKYGIFMQNSYCYKFNVFNQYESPWEGSRICQKKDLHSVDDLRQKILSKNIKYPNLINVGSNNFSSFLEYAEILKKEIYDFNPIYWNWNSLKFREDDLHKFYSKSCLCYEYGFKLTPLQISFKETYSYYKN